MSTLLTINVKNLESATQGFYFFQQPALYAGGPVVYSNSLFAQSLGNFNDTGSTLTFQVNMQYFAGIQQAHSTPQVGQSSGYASASRAIDLAPASGTANDWTTASASPLGLSQPTAGTGVQPGAFRITTPVYAPPAIFNVGSAVEVNGGIALSNFVVANPSNNTDCQPILKYYVQTGNYTPGTVMNFSASSVKAAVCDFTGGHSVINVTLNADGTWATETIQ
ncbi:hypothetical protein [Phyllobacterium myrsinacearum]|uniref:Uncharacterized protein n=1 Tax=Phyllobacterium myrsinacearum TaxID=28101 RepID=A0A839EQZ3_9HYPH|nr:hypothetical protein [Phyllobacterium myrsinacearum]MBA8879020.1 hypothetical protein [Phyllobacterium myrsinacearum]